MKLRRLPVPFRGERAFTMIEIALCIGIIGFALVAIIGVLPAGLTVQRENREETIVNQDARFLAAALRSGGTGAGLNVLAEHFDRISFSNNATGMIEQWTYGTAPMQYTTGAEVIGLMSRPVGAITNIVRAFSGALADRGASAAAKDFTFKYRLIMDVDPVTTDYVVPNSSPAVTRTVTNACEIRMRFDWPVLPSGSTGQGTKMFRFLAPGLLRNDTNNPVFFFLEPQTFYP